MEIKNLSKILKLVGRLQQGMFSPSGFNISFRRNGDALEITVPPEVAGRITVKKGVSFDEGEETNFSLSVKAFQKFTSALSKLSKDEVKITQNEGKLIVKDSNTKYTLAFEPYQTHNFEEVIKGASALAIIPNTLYDVVKLLKPIEKKAGARGTHSYTPYRNALLKGNENTIEIVATDGYRLAIVKKEAELKKKNFKVEVPINLLEIALPLPQETETIKIGENGNNFLIKYTVEDENLEAEVITALPKADAAFPKYENIVSNFDKEKKEGAASSINALFEALRKASAINDANSATLSSTDPALATFTAYNINGEMMETVVPTSKVLPRQLYFSPELLGEIISALASAGKGEEQIEIYPSKENGMVMFQTGKLTFILAELVKEEKEKEEEPESQPTPENTTKEEAA